MSRVSPSPPYDERELCVSAGHLQPASSLLFVQWPVEPAIIPEPTRHSPLSPLLAQGWRWSLNSQSMLLWVKRMWESLDLAHDTQSLSGVTSFQLVSWSTIHCMPPVFTRTVGGCRQEPYSQLLAGTTLTQNFIALDDETWSV